MGIFGNAFSGWHLLAIVFLVLLLFGAPKLPGLAKSVGQSMKIFRSEIKTDKTGKTSDVEEQPKADTTPADSATETTTSSTTSDASETQPKP